MGSNERHLLLGLLALKSGQFSKEALLSAFDSWSSNKTQSIGDILVSQGALPQEKRDALRQRVEHEFHAHATERQSVVSLTESDVDSNVAEMRQTDDTEPEATISKLTSVSPDPKLDSEGDRDQTESGPPLTDLMRSAFSADPTGVMGTFTSQGRYRVLRPLEGGQGGMGVINVAHDEELGRTVALKKIRSDRANRIDLREKFQVEAEVTGNLEHPGIVPIYGMGADSAGQPYYAMRLVHGDTLTKEIDNFHSRRLQGEAGYDSVELHALLDRLIDVAQAIGYAHRRGVIHRDLKPGNILVGNYGETLVIDWGLARLPRENPAADEADFDGLSPVSIRSSSHFHTGEGAVMGTLGYAPPEQVTGEVAKISESSDIYALGAILYQMLTNKRPIKVSDENGRRSAEQIIGDTKEGRIEPPHLRIPSIPKPLSAVCMKCLALEPSSRYDTSEELIEDLRRWKADQPVRARRESILEKLMRFGRKHRRTALAIALSLLVIASISTVAAIIVNQQRKDAEIARRGESDARMRAEERRIEAQDARVAAETAQKAEAAAKDDAQSLAERKKKVADVFVAAFQSADPRNKGINYEMTAKEVLQLARRQVQDELDDDPLTKADLLEALGNSFHGLGENESAILAMLEVESIRSAETSEEHVDTLLARSDLAGLYLATGRLEEAVTLHEQTLKTARRTLGNDHLEAQTFVCRLASAYHDVGRVEDALALYEPAVKLYTRHFGVAHPRTIIAVNALAKVYSSSGRTSDAINLYEQTLRVSKEHLGLEHPVTIDTMSSLASSYHETHRELDALPHFEKALELARRKFGPDHPSTLYCLHGLGTVYADIRRHADAIPLLEQTLEVRQRRLGTDHPETLRTMNNLATVYQKAGNLDQALSMLEQTFELRRKKLGDNHPRTLTTMHNIAHAYSQVGRIQEAIKYLEQAVKGFTQESGADHPSTLRSMNVLAATYKRAGRLTDAVQLFEEALKLTRDKLGPESLDVANYMINLATAYQACGRASDALPLFEESLEIRRKVRGPNHAFTLDAIRWLTVTRLELRQLKAAEASIRDWLEILESTNRSSDAWPLELLSIALSGQGKDEESIETARLAIAKRKGQHSAKICLGIGHARLGQFDEIDEKLLVESFSKMEANFGIFPSHLRWEFPVACEQLVELYELWERPEEAAKWKAKLAEVNSKIEALQPPKSDAEVEEDTGDKEAVEQEAGDIESKK